ncbi:MAG: TPM domain-containing protein [Alphaproteobacteria bacterium]|nr:MAG: TPM domain-containing protein [Alphaproteobacteria bacterium]
MNHWKFILFVVAALGIAAPQAQAAHPYNPSFKPVSQVLDNAGVFKPKTLQELRAYAEDSEYYTGNQLIIGIVPSFGGKTADAYALEAAQALKVSEQGKPGVLLIVSKGDRDARIVAGPQLAPVLSAQVQQAILERVILPNLKQGKIERGVIDGVGSIMMALQGKFVPPAVKMAQAQAANAGKTGWSPIAIIAVLFILRMALGGGRRYGRYGGYGGGGGSILGSVVGGIIGSMLMGGARRRW